tara:strand:+ start:457 stop:579 length:123 start_codon:yes stop_codon:yes gene_type:complete
LEHDFLKAGKSKKKLKSKNLKNPVPCSMGMIDVSMPANAE